VPSATVRAAVLVAVEGLALLVLAAAYAVGGLAGDPQSRAGAELGALFIALAGAALLAVARGLARRQGWSRSPAVVAQLLALPVGVTLAQVGAWRSAVPILVLAGAVLAHLALPQARAEFRTRA
jgi:hypothetical protein